MSVRIASIACGDDTELLVMWKRGAMYVEYEGVVLESTVGGRDYSVDANVEYLLGTVLPRFRAREYVFNGKRIGPRAS